MAVHLAVATPRAARASWLVEKGTELGVVSFRFFSCERAPRRMHAAGVKRLRRVAAAALEQSGRSLLPFIEAGLDLAALEEHLRVCERSVLLDPGAPMPFVVGAAFSSWVVVGPEGGFTLTENARLQAVTTVSARLGSSILRIETAALAASSLLLFGFQDSES
jgi:16S rRNA (uracil1498-N3)-methyltransferase